MTFHSSWRRPGGSSVLQRTILNDSPLAYWVLGEASGNFLDSSGNEYHLTPTGITYRDTCLLNDSTEYAYFNSATSRGNRAGTLGLSMPYAGDYTFEAVVMVAYNTSGNKTSLFALSSSGETLATNYQCSPGIETNGKLTDLWEYGSGTNVTVTSDFIIATCRPHHLVFQRDATNMLYNFYVNGMLSCQRTFANLPTGGTSNQTYLGWPTSSNGSFWMGHAAFFTSVLTEKQVRAHFIATGLQFA